MTTSSASAIALGQALWRDYVTDGVAASGPNSIDKADGRAWAQALAAVLSAIMMASTANYLVATATALPVASDGAVAVVLFDTADNNGTWLHSSGAWVRQAPLPVDSGVASAAAAAASSTSAGTSASNAAAALASAQSVAAGIGLLTASAPFSGTFTGSGNTITLPAAPTTVSQVLLFVGGIVQPPGLFSVSGTTLTLPETPPNGVAYVGFVMGSAPIQVLPPASLASQGVAIAGTDNGSWMSPLRVAQTIAALASYLINPIVYGVDRTGATDTHALIETALGAVSYSNLYMPDGAYQTTYAQAFQYTGRFDPRSPGIAKINTARLPFGDVTSNLTINIGAGNVFATMAQAINFLNDRRVRPSAILKFIYSNGTYAESEIDVNHPDSAAVQILGNLSTIGAVILNFGAANFASGFKIMGPGGIGLIDGVTINGNGWTSHGIWTAQPNPYGAAIYGYSSGLVGVGPSVRINKFYYGVRMERGARGYCAPGVIVTEAGDVGFHAFDGGALEARNCTATYCSDTSGNLGYAFLAELNSALVCNGSFGTYCAAAGFGAQSSSSMWAQGGNGSHNGTGFEAWNNGFIDCGPNSGAGGGSPCVASYNSGVGYWSHRGGNINAFYASADHSGGDGFLSDGGFMDCNQSIASYNGGYGHHALNGAIVRGAINTSASIGNTTSNTPTADSRSLINI